MRSEAVLGVDVGTSGAKVVLLSTDGALFASDAVTYPVGTPGPGRAESDPAQWTAAVETAVGQVLGAAGPHRLRAIGVVGQMHGAVLCDHTGAPVGPAVLWPDRRAISQLARWRALPQRQQHALANPLVAGMTGPIVAWLAAHRPDLVAQAERVLLAKDVVRAAIVDEPASPDLMTDRSDASATLLWDVPADRWAVEICDSVGVPARLLPDVVPSHAVVGQTGWTRRLSGGNPATVPVVAGAGDTPAALLAADPGGLLVNFGTGAQVLVGRAVPDRGDADPATHLYADAGDRWYAMAALQNGGLALDWVARTLGLSWDALIAGAARGASGSVTFLPFLSGERGGVASPSSHGGWLGIGPDTTRDDLARAAVEGVIFAIRRAVGLLGPGQPDGSRPVTLSGGGWRTDLLCRLVSNSLGRPVQRVDVPSASATGAALLAARGAGIAMPPRRSGGALFEPSRSGELEAGYRRWLARCAAAEA